MTALRSHARAFARRHAWRNAAPLLMALLLTACATPPTAPTEPEPQTIRARAPSDAKRIEELERQVAELQRQLNDRRRQSLESGLKYLIIGSLGSATLLYGMAFIYGREYSDK